MEKNNSNKIKRFITCLIPAYACNFRCHYCYLAQHNNAYRDGIKKFVMSPQKIAESLSVERLGGVCYFNLCAEGETLMHSQVVDLVDALTGIGHYCDIITNGSLKNKFIELDKKLDNVQKNHLFIKFSFHYLELKEKNMLASFVENVNIVKEAGISYSIEVTPNDKLVPYIDELKTFSLSSFGAYPHVTVARNEGVKNIALLTEYSRDEYKKIWSEFNSDLFDFKLSIFNQKRKEFCYAGLWSLWINLETGYYAQCYKGDRLGNIKNMDKPLNFRAIGKCKQPHCFNGHAFLALGDIPEINAPTYTNERDRITDDGEHWFNEDMRLFLSSKLYENNSELSVEEQKKQLMYNKFYYIINFFVKSKNKIMDWYKDKKS